MPRVQSLQGLLVGRKEAGCFEHGLAVGAGGRVLGGFERSAGEQVPAVALALPV